MPQSMLAFLAMMVLMLFAMQQQKASVETQREIISAEMEVAAGAVAAENLQYLRQAKKFDKNMSGRLEDLEDLDVEDLTPESDFGTLGTNCWEDSENSACGSVENFHGDTFQAKFQGLSSATSNEITFNFDVTDTRVEYVCKESDDLARDGCSNTDVGSGNQTFYKRLTLRLENQYMRRPVVISRRLSPGISSMDG